MSKDPNESYWKDYNQLQHVKHQLLQKYLGAWFPILSKWHGRVLYVECNAGRGRHEQGQPGSPILALETLLNHQSRDTILRTTEVNFVFFENDAKNYRQLQHEIAIIGQLPQNMSVFAYDQDYTVQLTQRIQGLRANSRTLAPSFIFVDPFGYSLSMNLLNDLLKFSRCELFITFMYRYVDLAMRLPAQAANINNLFGTTKWTHLVDSVDPNLRPQETLNLFADQLKAKYVSRMTMLAENNTVKYALFHATNNSLGRTKMKDAMWSVSPDGTFIASERHNPEQMVLIQPEPNLDPLKDNLWSTYNGQDVKMDTLYEWLVSELYREPHLHQVLTEYRKNKILKFNGDYKQVAFSKKPIISFPPIRPIGS